MKSLAVLATVAGLAGQCNPHFTTGHLLVNGTDTGLWKHVLEVAVFGNPLTNGGYPKDNHLALVEPQYAEDVFTTNITCGRAAFNSMSKTEIADVVAGEDIGFRTMSGAEVNAGGSYGYFYHPGPAQVWLSRTPSDDLKSYHGDGDWFKVAYAGPRSNTEWQLYGDWSTPEQGTTDYNFTLPKTTPPGKYLLRFEYIMPSARLNGTQWFVNCALINLIGAGGGTPTGFAKHPGAYDADDIGLWVPFNQEYRVLPADQMRIKEYKPPGPPVWTG